MNARAALLPALLAAMAAVPVMARAQAGSIAAPFAPLASDPSGHREVLPQWRPLPAPSLQYHSAVYDPRRHRVIAFGGMTDFPSDWSLEELTNRTWELSLDGAAWREVVSRGPVPPPRIGHTAIYDPIRDRLIVFGGDTGLYGQSPLLNDVWTLSLSGEPVWTRLEIRGALPSPRADHVAIYDPVHDAMLVFGGWRTRWRESSNEVWSLSLSGTPTWSKQDISGGPSPVLAVFGGDVTAYSAVFDSKRRRMVVIGRDPHGGLDAWALSLTGLMSWARLSPSGKQPVTRLDQSSIYDPDGDRVIVFGEYVDVNDVKNACELKLAGNGSWSIPQPVGHPPSQRLAATTLYDSRKHRMLVVGGVYSPEQGMDTRALSLRGPPEWSTLVDVGPQPSGREGHTAVYDSRRGRMVIYGGDSGESYPSTIRYVCALSLNGDQRWTNLSVRSCCVPEAGRGHSATYDPIRDRMLVFGGITDQPEHVGLGESRIVNELWSFNLSGEPAWSKIDAAGEQPPPRMGHIAIYDPYGDRMVVFGGRDFVTALDDVWALSLAEPPRWTKITPEQPGPGPRSVPQGVYDPDGKRMLLAGNDGETWALSLVGNPAWSKLSIPARPPGHMLYDSKHGTLVVWDGTRCWALALSGRQVWKEIRTANAPPARSGESVTYDPQNEQIVVFGGRYDMNDTWALSLKTMLDPVRDLALAGAAPSVSLSPPTPNPSSCEAQVEFALSQAGRVSLIVFDAAGRRVRSLADGAFTPGRHTLRWDGRDAAGHFAPTGLYFMRLEAGGQSITQKTVIAR